MDDIDDLLRLAAAADASVRVELYRDRIAASGVAAIERLTPWLRDDRLGAFAVVTVERAAAEPGALKAARTALQRGRSSCSDSTRRLIDAALPRLGPARSSSRD